MKIKKRNTINLSFMLCNSSGRLQKVNLWIARIRILMVDVRISIWTVLGARDAYVMFCFLFPLLFVSCILRAGERRVKLPSSRERIGGKRRINNVHNLFYSKHQDKEEGPCLHPSFFEVWSGFRMERLDFQFF